MIRLASLLLLASQVVLLLLLQHPSGATAIGFTFVGAPLLAAGLALLALAGFRERRRRSGRALQRPSPIEERP